jgi:hypothetical protein
MIDMGQDVSPEISVWSWIDSTIQPFNSDRSTSQAPKMPTIDATNTPLPSQVHPKYANPPTTISFVRAASRLRRHFESIGNGATVRVVTPCDTGRTGTKAENPTARWSEVGNNGSALYASGFT